MNFFPAEVLRQSANSLPLPANAHTVGLRPEHVLLDEAGPLEYRVQQVEQMGSTSLLRGTLAGSTNESQTPAHFEVVSNGQTSVKAGQTVRLSMPPAALHFFDEQGARLQELTS